MAFFGWAILGPSLVASAAIRVLIYVLIIVSGSLSYAALLRRYERAGRAIELPRRTTRIDYGTLPKPVLALRIAFVVVVALMLLFGLAPIPEARAHAGIGATVVALLVLGLLSLILEAHYLRTGRAKQTDS